MRFSTPCPRCQAPFSLGRLMTVSSPSQITCSQCNAQLRLKPWAWAITIIFFIAVLAVGGFFLYQRIAADVAVRGLMRLSILGILLLAMLVNIVALQFGPFYVDDETK